MKEELLRQINVGGKIVRFTEDNNFYYLYEGKKLIQRFVKEYITKKTVWQVTTDYIFYLKQLQEKFEDDKLPIDDLISQAEKEVRKELIKRLRQFFKQIPKASVKETESMKEDFLGLKIFPKLTDVFSGFNKFVNKTVDDVLKKLKVEVIDDIGDTGETVSAAAKKDIVATANLMKRQVKDSIVGTKDNMLKDIKRDMIQGITANQSVTSIKQGIEKKYNYSNGIGWKSARSVRTTLSNANTVLKFKKWLNMGFTKFEWITRDDKKVRPTHAAKNHRVYDIKKVLADTNNWDAYPGKSANCRCSAILYE